MIFLLCGQITRQAVRQVVAVPCRTKTFQKGSQIIFHVTPHHLAALDHRVHERVVPGRPLASDVPGVLQVHLYPTHHLLAEVVRQFHVATLKHPFHRRPFAYRIFQGLPQQFAAAREIRLPEHLQTLLFPPHYVSRVHRLKAFGKSLRGRKDRRHPCLGQSCTRTSGRSSARASFSPSAAQRRVPP